MVRLPLVAYLSRIEPLETGEFPMPLLDFNPLNPCPAITDPAPCDQRLDRTFIALKHGLY